MNVCVAIPTLNPGPLAERLVASLERQANIGSMTVLVLDSSSSDGSLGPFARLNAIIHRIPRNEFDHGGTRNLAFDLINADVYVFLTQDIVLRADDSIAALLDAFQDPSVGVAYGRQRPYEDATPAAAHARLFNYGEVARLVGVEDIPTLGPKAAFCSNSFAAYRREAIINTGRFPGHLIFGEDGFAAAKMILSGWKLFYAAEAEVLHSHNYSYAQEFRRYFDLGVSHSSESWFLKRFGRAEGEGSRFVFSEYRYLQNAGQSWALVRVLSRNALRYLAYRLGRLHKMLPQKINAYMSSNKAYWKR